MYFADEKEKIVSVNPEDFYGCRRACRKAGGHTKTPGECVAGPLVNRTVSISRHAIDGDGYPIIVLDSYTWQELTDLIVPKLKYLIDGHGDKISPEALAGHVASTIISREEA